MEQAILKIETDIKVNERCLQEEIDPYVKELLKIWIKYDQELLQMLLERK